MKEMKTILAVGSIALDTLETPNGNRQNMLGGSATYFSLAASIYTHVKIVAVVGDDFPKSGWKIFKSRNIDTENINILNGKTFSWGGKYSQDYSQRETLFTELGVFDSFSPTIKNNDSRIQCVFLGNIQPKLQLDVAKQINFARYIASDTMNLWINLFPKQLKNVLQISDIFLINDEEAHQFTGKKDVSESAHIFHSFGPKVVIIKMGANGAYLSFEDKSVFIPVFPINKVIDPTGAGDSFAGGLLGSLASVDYPNLVEAVLVGTAMASYCVEDFGVDGLLRATMPGLNERLSVIREHMSEYGGS